MSQTERARSKTTLSLEGWDSTYSQNQAHKTLIKIAQKYVKNIPTTVHSHDYDVYTQEYSSLKELKDHALLY